MSNWSLLYFADNPTPGDAGAIESMSSTYNSNGQTFADLADFINSVGKNPEMVGDYAEKFASEVTPLVGDFRAFGESFEQVGSALSSWAAELPGFQQISQDCLQRAEAAEADRLKFVGLVNSQSTEVWAAKRDAATASDDEQRSADRRLSAAESTLANYQNKLSTAVDELEQARQDAQGNAQEYQTAARQYADTVDAAQDHSPQLSWWETVYYSNAWNIIVQIALVVSIAATFAGFILGGWILPLVGLITAVIVYADDLMGFFAGDKNGWQLAVSTVFLALSAVGNVGKIADSFGAQGRAAWKATEGWNFFAKFKNAASARSATTANVKPFDDFKHFADSLLRPGALRFSDYREGARLISSARSLDAAKRNGELLMGTGKITGALSKTKSIFSELAKPDGSWVTGLAEQSPLVAEMHKAVKFAMNPTGSFEPSTNYDGLGDVMRHFTTPPATDTDATIKGPPSGTPVPGLYPHPMKDLDVPLAPKDYSVPPYTGTAPAVPTPSPATSVSVPEDSVADFSVPHSTGTPDTAAPSNSSGGDTGIDLNTPQVPEVPSVEFDAPKDASSVPSEGLDIDSQHFELGNDSDESEVVAPSIDLEQPTVELPPSAGSAEMPDVSFDLPTPAASVESGHDTPASSLYKDQQSQTPPAEEPNELPVTDIPPAGESPATSDSRTEHQSPEFNVDFGSQTPAAEIPDSMTNSDDLSVTAEPTDPGASLDENHTPAESSESPAPSVPDGSDESGAELPTGNQNISGMAPDQSANVDLPIAEDADAGSHDMGTGPDAADTMPQNFPEQLSISVSVFDHQRDLMSGVFINDLSNFAEFTVINVGIQHIPGVVTIDTFVPTNASSLADSVHPGALTGMFRPEDTISAATSESQSGAWHVPSPQSADALNPTDMPVYESPAVGHHDTEPALSTGGANQQGNAEQPGVQVTVTQAAEQVDATTDHHGSQVGIHLTQASNQMVSADSNPRPELPAGPQATDDPDRQTVSTVLQVGSGSTSISASNPAEDNEHEGIEIGIVSSDTAAKLVKSH